MKKGEKYWFFKYWPDQDVRVDVIDFCRLPWINHIERFWLKFYVLQVLKSLPKMKNYDLILSHGAQSGVLLAMIRSFLDVKRPPHIIIDVGCFNGGRDKKTELLPLRMAARSLTGVITHSSYHSDYYERCLPYLKDKNRFVPFGTDPEFFKPLSLKAKDYIICVGYVKRDWDTFLKAFDSLSWDVKLKLVGVKDALGYRVPFSSHPRIECLPYVDIQKLKELIAQAKFMVLPLPFFKYSFGQMTLLQAMSLGKAVVVTSVPGILDYVEDGYNALLVKPDDSFDLRDKMESLIKDEKKVIELGRNARKTVLEKFNEKNLALNLYNAIGELCGGVN